MVLLAPTRGRRASIVRAAPVLRQGSSPPPPIRRPSRQQGDRLGDVPQAHWARTRTPLMLRGRPLSVGPRHESTPCSAARRSSSTATCLVLFLGGRGCFVAVFRAAGQKLAVLVWWVHSGLCRPGLCPGRTRWPGARAQLPPSCQAPRRAPPPHLPLRRQREVQPIGPIGVPGVEILASGSGRRRRCGWGRRGRRSGADAALGSCCWLRQGAQEAAAGEVDVATVGACWVGPAGSGRGRGRRFWSGSGFRASGVYAMCNLRAGMRAGPERVLGGLPGCVAACRRSEAARARAHRSGPRAAASAPPWPPVGCPAAPGAGAWGVDFGRRFRARLEGAQQHRPGLLKGRRLTAPAAPGPFLAIASKQCRQAAAARLAVARGVDVVSREGKAEGSCIHQRPS
jgi:hypothetical protein